ncbi:MAG: nuclear transport factor 2 family protein [Alphaproteobacteria bacterium]
MSADIDAAAAAYAAFFETLSADGLDRLDALCAPDVFFRDPFNEVVGVAAFRAVLAKMFRDVAAPRFAVTDRARSGRTVYLRWTFAFGRGRRSHRIEGMSEVHFDAAGRVEKHIDHWDGSEVYRLVPLLGAAIRLVRRRIAAG